MALIVTLANDTPKYFMTQDVAFERHYTEGGYLWKRKDGMCKTYKPFASGILPLARLEIYELYMVNGRKPTDENIQDAQKACREAMDLDCAIM
jgi:hypothetical protein